VTLRTPQSPARLLFYLITVALIIWWLTRAA